MCVQCEARVSSLWRGLAVGQVFMTPDHINGREFEVSQVNPDSIEIPPQAIAISQAAFVAALAHLFHNAHGIENPCLVGSSNSATDSGPLCTSSRLENNGVRCINYILPVLQRWGVVGIHGGRSNSTWLLAD